MENYVKRKQFSNRKDVMQREGRTWEKTEGWRLRQRQMKRVAC
jgi:hypothetical protein